MIKKKGLSYNDFHLKEMIGKKEEFKKTPLASYNNSIKYTLTNSNRLETKTSEETSNYEKLVNKTSGNKNNQIQIIKKSRDIKIIPLSDREVLNQTKNGSTRNEEKNGLFLTSRNIYENLTEKNNEVISESDCIKNDNNSNLSFSHKDCDFKPFETNENKKINENIYNRIVNTQYPINKEKESLENYIEYDNNEKVLYLGKFCLFREFKIKKCLEEKMNIKNVTINKVDSNNQYHNKINLLNNPVQNIKQPSCYSPIKEKVPEFDGCSPIQMKNNNHILLKEDFNINPISEVKSKLTILKEELLREIGKIKNNSSTKLTRNQIRISSFNNYDTLLHTLSETRKIVNNPNFFKTQQKEVKKDIKVFSDFLSPKSELNKCQIDMKQTLEKFYEKNQLFTNSKKTIKASTKFEIYNLKNNSEFYKQCLLNDLKNNISTLKNTNVSIASRMRNKSII